MNVSRIAVFGDSLIWGQGLLPAQKMSTLVNQRLTGGAASCALLAHSGAVIGVDINPPRPPFPNDGFREVPRPYPTILQQVKDFADHPETVDLVLVGGGSNDVGFEFILNPLTNLDELRELTRLFCGEHFKQLLDKVRQRCPNAKIIAVGQYPILSAASDTDLIHLLLGAHFIAPLGGLLEGLAALNITRASIKDKVVALSTLFWTESNASIQAAVTALGDPRIGCAFAPFTAEHAAFTNDPWLFGLSTLLRPEDPMADVRRGACDLSTEDLFKRFICHRASVGHPNVTGSQKYADAIVDAFRRL